MKTPTWSKLLLVGFGSALMSVPTSGTPVDDTAMTRATGEKIRSVLPAYSSRTPTRPMLGNPAPATVFRCPNVVLSPPPTVQAGVVRRMSEDSLYERGAFDRALVKRELPFFDRCILNRYTLPLFGVSNEVRVRQAHHERSTRQFHDEVNAFARVETLTSPAEASSLRAALRQWQ